MRLKLPLIILGLYFILISLTGCETVKGAAHGFYRDYENTKRNTKKVVNIICQTPKKVVNTVCETTKKVADAVRETTKGVVDKAYEKTMEADERFREELW